MLKRIYQALILTAGGFLLGEAGGSIDPKVDGPLMTTLAIITLWIGMGMLLTAFLYLIMDSKEEHLFEGELGDLI